MHSAKKQLTLFLLILFPVISFADVFIAKNTLDSGSGSLRQAISDASINPGWDTIYIDVRGTILLESALDITDNEGLNIIGPSPKHITLASTGSWSGSLMEINGAANVSIDNVGFGPGLTTTRYIEVFDHSGIIRFARCLFEGNNFTGGDGGAIRILSPVVAAPVEIRSCSFVDNQAGQGGAVFIDGGDVVIVNSTFSGNIVSSGSGGAICVISVLTSPLKLVNNTFKDNAVTGGGQGHAVYTQTEVEIQNTASDLNGSAGSINQFYAGGSGSFISLDGNVINLLSGEPAPFTAEPKDKLSSGIDLALHDPIVTDGFGLKYYTIIEDFSECVENGVPPTGISIAEDCRSAPRALDGDGSATLEIDAGAAEYTPLRVTSYGGSILDIGSLPEALLMPSLVGVSYVEFDLPAPDTISPDAILAIADEFIIDAYSQTGSAVPGPGTSPGTVTPGIPGAVIDNGGTSAVGLRLGLGSDNSRVQGLRINSFTQSGVRIESNECKLFGNMIGVDGVIDQGNGEEGVLVSANEAIIGGNLHWQRNVISGNGTAGGSQSNISIVPGVGGTQIIGNFIGPAENGNTGLPLNANTGISIQSTSNTLIGKGGYGGKNVIGGHNNNGVLAIGASFLDLYNNYIGVSYNGTDAIPNTDIGVNLISGNDINIGSPIAVDRNVISGNEAINLFIGNCSELNVYNNLIGPDAFGTSTPGSSSYPTILGVVVNALGSSNVRIGSALSSEYGNYISGNQIGVEIQEVGDGFDFLNNYVGFQSDGLGDLGNQSTGIHIGSAISSPVNIGQAGTGNYIGWHDEAGGGTGVHVEGGSGHNIVANVVGLSTDMDTDAPNETGIEISAASSVLIGGTGSADRNIISSNVQSGILVQNGADGTNIYGNIIGLNGTETADKGNGESGITVKDATNTTIGIGNVICGHNSAFGVGIHLQSTGTNTVVSETYIGVNSSGLSSFGNAYGILVRESHSATIGSTTVGAENRICNSDSIGVYLNVPGTVLNGNYIGKDASDSPAGNKTGVLVDTNNVTIGGTFGTMVVVASTEHGIWLNGDDVENCTIDNCYIGLDGLSTPGMGNGMDGIRIEDGDNNAIGSSVNNIIAGNGTGIHLINSANDNSIDNCSVYDPFGGGLDNDIGIHIEDFSSLNEIGTSGPNDIHNSTNEGIRIENNSNENIVTGNHIGAIFSGYYPNSIGINIINSNYNQITGDLSASSFNLISGNDSIGILLDAADSNFIGGNLIGTNQSGTGAVSNLIGINTINESTGNTIGGVTLTDKRNVISGNIEVGVLLESPGNFIKSNFVGLGLGGTTAVSPNQEIGIYAGPDAISTEIGGIAPLEVNFVANHSEIGIAVEAPSCEVYGNRVGANLLQNSVGTQPIGIQVFSSAAANNLIGNSPANDLGNIVVGHTVAGIAITDGALNNDVAANFVGLDDGGTVSGTQSVGVLTYDVGTGNRIGVDDPDKGNFISYNETGILIDSSQQVSVFNNFIGVSTDGHTDGPNDTGIKISNHSSGNQIGGSAAHRSNIIASNINEGVYIEGTNTELNTVSGNVIGLSVDTTGSVTGNSIGVAVSNGAHDNQIGETVPGGGNIICANGTVGVLIDGASHNNVQNNKMGPVLSNTNGVAIINGSEFNTLGGSDLLAKNVISNNDSVGVFIQNSNQNQVLGNIIGLNPAGDDSLPNLFGVILEGGEYNRIGGPGLNEGNMISSNYGTQIFMDNSFADTIQNNFMGTNLSGSDTVNSAALIGVYMFQTDSVVLGGNVSTNEGNVIVNHEQQGVYLEECNGVKILGNNIGINADSSSYFGNGAAGVLIAAGSSENTIGDAPEGFQNSITANLFGIVVDSSSNNKIRNNFIGNNSTGLATAIVVGDNNQIHGIVIANGSFGNSITNKNIISGNMNDGIRIRDIDSDNNEVYGNFIGLDESGGETIPNNQGVSIIDGASSNVIGGPGLQKNIISGNTTAQVSIFGIQSGVPASNNEIIGNYIGLSPDGSTTYTTTYGIGVFDGATNNFIGSDITDGGNRICGIDSTAIYLFDASEHTTLYNNIIGIKPDGSSDITTEVAVMIDDSDSNRVGGIDPLQGNELAFCNNGIQMISAASGNTILANSIHNITNQGIDIDGDGTILTSDSLLITSGNNDEIDSPVLLSAFACGGNTQIAYTLPVPAGNYIVEFFRSGETETEYGDGKDFIYRETVTVSAAGDTLSADLGTVLEVDSVITATVTLSGSSTSEFSNNIAVSDGPPVADYLIASDTCFGANNGYIQIVAPEATYFWYDTNPYDYVTDSMTYNLSAGTYTVGKGYANGCELDTSIVLDTGPYLTFTATALSDTCGQGVGAISISGETGGISPYAYSYDAGTTYVTNSDTNNLTTGTYTILITDDVYGCLSEPVDVEVLNENIPVPALDIVTIDTEYCPGETLQPLEVTPSTVTNWFESYPSTPVATAITYTPTSLNPGDNYIYWTNVDPATGCTTELDSISYYLSDTSLMYADPDMRICKGSEVEIRAYGGESYLWGNHPDINDVTVENPIVKPGMETIYTVTITDSYSCTKMDAIAISFSHPDSCNLEAFTAFSPDGDGVNDFLYIEGIEGYPENRVFIMNRWGEQIKKIEGYDNDTNAWDGTTLLGEAKPGTYFYVIDVGDKGGRNLSGWIQLMR